MELDELRAGWAELDQRLDRVERSRDALEARTVISGVRTELRPLIGGQIVQLLVGTWLALQAGAFWMAHRQTSGLLVSGLLLHLYGIAMIAAAARSLVLATGLDESLPVLDVQARIVALRAWRIREGRWFGLVGSFMWVAMIVCVFGMLGVDILVVNPAFVVWNLLAAFVCVGVFAAVSFLRPAQGGSAVRRAQARLDEVARFRDIDRPSTDP
ncbi:hypothetical protein [Xanthomonas sp. NCPPB 2632]|uniref:hypothetical protein n=1 Tax=Xanthomonas sp. NCPPB 2632 TaxID=3240912 RepID=UPI0035162938